MFLPSGKWKYRRDPVIPVARTAYHSGVSDASAKAPPSVSAWGARPSAALLLRDHGGIRRWSKPQSTPVSTSIGIHTLTHVTPSSLGAASG